MLNDDITLHRKGYSKIQIQVEKFLGNHKLCEDRLKNPSKNKNY